MSEGSISDEEVEFGKICCVLQISDCIDVDRRGLVIVIHSFFIIYSFGFLRQGFSVLPPAVLDLDL